MNMRLAFSQPHRRPAAVVLQPPQLTLEIAQRRSTSGGFQGSALIPALLDKLVDTSDFERSVCSIIGFLEPRVEQQLKIGMLCETPPRPEVRLQLSL
jgi:hypothetical protein